MADAKITQLAEETSPALDDLVAIVDDVAGTPTTKKATLANVLALAGGGATFSSALASPPASPVAGDLWLPTNSFFIYRYSGTVWVPWGPMFQLTPPVNGDFSWVNQGGASVDTTFGGIYLEGPAGAAVNVRMRSKAAPSTPYTITAGFLTTGSNASRNGIGFRSSSTGKLSTLEILNGYSIAGSNWDSPTSFNSAFMTTLECAIPPIIWFRIQDNGTNRIYQCSADGQHFITLFTVGRTTFLTADEVGFFVHDTSNLYAPNLTLLSWKET